MNERMGIMWVLIIVAAFGGGQAGQGITSVQQVEFRSQAKCEAAAHTIKNVAAYCFEK